MAIKVGRILIWFILLFLVAFVFLQLSFTERLMTDYGTSVSELLPFILIMGLVFITLVDAVRSE